MDVCPSFDPQIPKYSSKISARMGASEQQSPQWLQGSKMLLQKPLGMLSPLTCCASQGEEGLQGYHSATCFLSAPPLDDVMRVGQYYNIVIHSGLEWAWLRPQCPGHIGLPHPYHEHDHAHDRSEQVQARKTPSIKSRENAMPRPRGQNFPSTYRGKQTLKPASQAPSNFHCSMESECSGEP